MMIKVFTLNKNNKIELTEEELKQLLDQVYWEGYNNNINKSFTWTIPKWSPYITTSSISSDSITKGNITVTNNTNSFTGE